MEKNKGLFSFRKHPVGNFLDEKKGRKRKGGRLHRSMGFLMAAALIFNTLPASGLAVSASEQEKGLCEHHPEHTAECGYTEAQPCTHEHTEECYKTVTECVHEHTDGCYPETEESTGEGSATDSGAENREPSKCTHSCSEESGCITKVLDCHHEHDENCGYQEAQDCGYVCEICNGTEPEDTGENTENTEAVGTDTAECICKTLCTEDSINGDCPVCGADDASFLDCKGKVSEENMGEQEDTGICKHHQEHDADCGYIPKSENGEGSPCTYECRICPIEVLIAALPDTVTEDNAADVRAQLDKILALYREMNEDEQGQLDLSRVTELQGALDAANAPMTAEGRTERLDTDEASVTIDGETLYYATLEEAFAAANGQTAAITMLADAECVHSGSNGSPLNITGGNVTLNLNGKTLSGNGYGAYGIIDVSGGSLLVQGEDGKVKVVVIGLSCRGNGKLTVEGITLELGGSDSFVANAGVDNEGGTVILNGTKMTGAASSGQIYHYSGTTTINNVTATGTTENCPKSVWYFNEGTLTINGGTFDKIVVGDDYYTGDVKSVAELLGEGYTYRKQDGTWATDDELAAMEILNVTVEKIPLTINPKGDTSWYYNTQQTHTLAMNAAPVDSGNSVSYAWKNGAETLNCAEDAYTVPAGMPVGSYTYTCEATCDGYTLSHTFTFKIEKSGTDLTSESKVLTYNGDTLTTSFTASDTITVKATPTATGAAPTNGAMLAASFAEPAAGQMAVFVGDTQVSEPATASDGTYTMTARAADVLLAARGPGTGITLTAKFIGNDNMADGTGTVTVNITAVAVAEKDGKVIGYYGESNLDKAFANDGATVTLLDNITTSMHVGVDTGNLTLDLNGKTITKPASYGLYVSGSGHLTIRGNGKVICTGTSGHYPEAITSLGGTLTLESGTFIGIMYGVHVRGETSVLSVTGESVSIQCEGRGLYISQAQSVELSAGTYSSISVYTFNTLASLLAENCAYYRGSTPILLSELEGQKTLDGTVTVQECQHTGVEVKDLGSGKHGLDCPYCGYHSEHTTTLTATVSGNTVTFRGGCESCDYRAETLATAAFTIPKLTYGQTDQTVSCTWEHPNGYALMVQIDSGEELQIDVSDTQVSLPLKQLFGSQEINAGNYQLHVYCRSYADVTSNVCSLPVTVDPAPLPEVTLSAESATYSGKEQKPTVTVAGLTEGTDYEVSYTRDGVVTNDFTSAGTVKITVTGKGNYRGEVEKTFTIKQAESDVGTVTAETLENTLDVSQVVLSRTNQTLAGTLMLTDSTLKYGTNTYTWKFTPDDTVNYKAATGTVQVTVNDTIAPSAEYRLGTDGWKKFVNTVTFGLFCKDFKTVDIRSTDDTDAVTGSGIASTQYYISDQEITDTDSIVWETYTKPISLDALGKYFIYVKVTDNAGNTAVLNSEGIVIYAESTVSPAVFDYTYKENRDCTVQLAMNGNTFKGFTDREGNAVDIDDYTIDGDGRLILKAAYLDTLDQGEYAYTVSVNPQGIETDQVALAYTFTVNVKARELTVTGAAATDRAYDGTNKVEITAVMLDGIVGSDTVAVDVSGIQGTLSSANAGRYTSVTLPQLTLTGADSGNYTLVQPQTAVPASVEITPLSAVITVGTDTHHKTFGDAAFTLDVTDNNAEADVQYEVTKGTDVVSVENGTVTIQSAGTAEIRVSLPASTNYTAAENKTITVRVDKKSGYTVAALNRNYFYQDGGTDSIDLAELLPNDCGNVTYGEPAVSGSVAYSAAPAVSGGKLSYTLDSGSVNDAGTVTVTVATRNYEDITVTVNVKLTDQIPVSLKTGTEVTLENNILTYGEPLSKLAFNEAEFVTADGESVTGTLAWKEAAATPNAGTASAVWIFTPVEDKYASLEGTAAITVNKAVPTVSAVPTVADRIYNPSVTLKGDDLTGATVTGVDGNTLKGGWNWQSADIVPTVNNNGYAAIFTPEDTTNYETVTRTITVNVAKATPYIAKSPAAAGITYGDILNASALSGGTVQYGNGAGQAGDGAGSTAAVAGTFTWKEPSAKPVVADSNVTEYTVVFTPSDTANYNPVEAEVTLTVNKAQNAPNMPGSTMDVSNSLEKVGDVSLPEGWEWQASDQDTALEVGKPVSAVAVYAGADKGNYEKETVTVAITRSACDHVAGEILYTGAGEKAPTCTEDGLGHRECTKCGSVVESGIVVKALGHTGGTATCSKRAVCTRCGQPYGDTDGSVHGDTEVRGFTAATCTAGGYTGDTYCKDCGAKTKTGNATPALGHNYTSTVTKEPTTGSEGTRTYTCTRCGHSYTESIPKLPEETHHHSYTESVTKQPTCTDTGIRTYTCSCGDSYTETIAALGHHYQSSVTKQPTTTAEGVMTYTCDRCGHSYTRPIAKLPGDDTSKPGDDTTKPGDDTTKPKDDTTKPGDDAAKPGDTKPDGGIAETRPDTGIPFIKDEDGKIGWDVIRAEEEQAQEGSTINVDMNGSVVVPGDIFDSIKGKDITITFDMGDGIIWSVNGKSITIDKAGDIDFSVQTGVNTVPVDIVNNVTGERYSIQISLAHEGEFGFTAVLSIGLGRENAGYTASLYYYNKSTGELEFICSDEVAEDGTVSLAFTHASDYVIAIDGDEEEESSSVTETVQPEDEAGDSAGKEEELPQTGQAWRPWWFIVVGALVIIMGVFYMAKRKKESGR